VHFPPPPAPLAAEQLVRHLAGDDAAIEYWLGHRDFDGFRAIRWLRIAHEGGSWAVYEKEVLDMGGIDFFDMDEFIELGDPDEPEGVRTAFSSAGQAIERAIACGASHGGFVARGGLQARYVESIATLPRPRYGAVEWLRPAKQD